MNRRHLPLLALICCLAAAHAADDAAEKKLAAARDRHAQDVEKASAGYHAAVEKANGALTKSYQGVIAQLEKKDPSAAAAAKAELDRLTTAAAEPAPAKPKGHVKLIADIGDTLLRADKTAVDPRTLADKRLVLLYYSASWCGPCKAFTPDLVKFHQEYAAKGIEVVLVGSDNSEADQMAYMVSHQMPWLAVPFARIDASTLKPQFGGDGIPHLVALDPDGKVVSSSVVDGQYVGPRKVLDDVRKLLR